MKLTVRLDKLEARKPIERREADSTFKCFASALDRVAMAKAQGREPDKSDAEALKLAMGNARG